MPKVPFYVLGQAAFALVFTSKGIWGGGGRRKKNEKQKETRGKKNFQAARQRKQMKERIKETDQESELITTMAWVGHWVCFR